MKAAILESDEAFIQLYSVYFEEQHSWQLHFFPDAEELIQALPTLQPDACFLRTDHSDSHLESLCHMVRQASPELVLLAVAPSSQYQLLHDDLAHLTFNLQFSEALIELLIERIHILRNPSSDREVRRFQLFYSDTTSVDALLPSIQTCLGSDRQAGACDIEPIDVTEQPDLAEAANVMATPMLLRVSPQPRIRLVGHHTTPATLARFFGSMAAGGN